MQNKPIDYSDAINSLCPGSSWKVEDGDLESMEWYDESIPKPSVTEILQEISRLEQERENIITEQESLKLSAIAKLSDLGLTEDEAKALIGL